MINDIFDTAIDHRPNLDSADGAASVWEPSPKFLTALELAASAMPGPLRLPWPMPGDVGGFLTFDDFGEWSAFFLKFSLHRGVPAIVRAKFGRALKLHLVAWLDFDLIKAGEMVAMATLELAIRDVYGAVVKAKKIKTLIAKGEKVPDTIVLGLSELLECMVKLGRLSDDKLPISRRTGGTVKKRLRGASKPSITQIRNLAMHGDPFDGFPQAGLLELVRDLIEFAYRDRISEHDARYGVQTGGTR